MFRHYDEAIKEFLTRKMPNGATVPIVGPVPPQKAFASMRELLKDDPRVKKDPRFIPLPIISFNRLSPEFAQYRYQGANLRALSYSDDANKTTVAERPMPWDIPYTVEIWAEKEDDGLFLLEAYQRQWRRPYAYIDVWHGEPFGNYRIGIAAPSVEDNSLIETDGADREIRFTLSFTVEAFMTFPAKWIPTVRQVVYEEDVSNRPLSQPDDIDQHIIPFDVIGEETK